MREKQRIELRAESGEKIGEIDRVLTAESIGNFNPIFCTYKGDRFLVRSEAGDLSDPFRRDPSYLGSLYIKIGGELAERARAGNKFLYLWIVQGNYGSYGFEDLTASESYREARSDLRSYRENEIGISHRLIYRRELRAERGSA